MERLKLLTTPSLAGNIPKFFLYNFLYAFMLWLPIWVIYLQQDHGFSLAQVTFIDLAFWLTVAVSEVPTGVAADTLGRKHSQLIGLLLSGVSVALFALAPSFPVLLFANSLWAVAITFISGADMAFFYDSLRALGREGEYKLLRGRLASLTLASLAVSSVLGSLIAETSLVRPFLVYLVFVALAILVALRFEEPPVDTDPVTGERPSYRQILTAASQALRTNANMRVTMLYAGFLPLFITIVSIIFMQSYALEIGLPIRSLGLLVFGLRLVDMLASSSSDRIVTRLGEWSWLQLAPILVVIGLLGIALIPSLFGILIYAIASFAVFVSRPLLEDIMQRQTQSSNRATILSVESLLRTLLLALIEPLLGVAADARGLPFSFLLMAASAAVILTLLLLRWRPLFHEALGQSIEL